MAVCSLQPHTNLGCALMGPLLDIYTCCVWCSGIILSQEPTDKSTFEQKPYTFINVPSMCASWCGRTLQSLRWSGRESCPKHPIKWVTHHQLYILCCQLCFSDGWFLDHRWWSKPKQTVGCPKSCQNTQEKFGEEVNLQDDWESASNWTSSCSSQISFISSGFWYGTCRPATTSWSP